MLEASPAGGGATGEREHGYARLESELRSEQASALGRLGRAIEEAMAALREAPAGASAARSRLVDEAAHAVWSYFVMREALGIYYHQPAIEVFGITNEVMARVGAVRSLP